MYSFIQVTTGVGKVRLVNIANVVSIEESRQISGGSYLVVNNEISYHVKESIEEIGRLISCPVVPIIND